ncbi:tetratricopeptide repeat protein 27 isoform X4 [Stegastes partitus]|uniref:Tetratricopeptide repeat protein 27 n=1 Tax=Stegastes partitus TaxID=144197 RepID=A0A9Y4NX03_9TELE|nr:PREDICTED: tetratricopeptide repeat protein 27 isoform X2 [Stegastes partitus]XP_008305055.1 PREDICTED: tetratricopeptide repeat protein 27 isoform X4 [Stegastes partitus]
MPLDVELPVLRGFLTASEAAEWKQNVFSTAEAGPLLESLMEGDFEAVLLNPQIIDLLTGDGNCSEGEDIETYLEKRVLLYLNGGTNDNQNNRELAVMTLAVSCLHAFAQSNWTGPLVSFHICDLLPQALLSSQPQTLVEAVHSSLLLDGESVYSLVANPFLLLLARVILIKCSSKMDSLQLLPWWTLRYINLHQQILEARSPQLFNLAQSSMDKVLKCQSVLSEQRNLAIQFYLECAYTNLTYYEYQSAREHIMKAQELSGLNINMTGALGKRTRFQQKYLAQLILEVKRKQDQPDQMKFEASPTPTPQAILPKDYNLGDDTVLDNINLAEPDQYELPDLSAEEQAVVLGICTNFQKNNPVHKLTEEELLAFTSCILSQPKFWAVEVTALCLRTRLEKSRTRCVERAMMQTQAIVDYFEDKSCPVTERLKVFYCCQAPPRWTVQQQLASLLTDLGCISSALLMYEKLELWEDAVVCYERLGQHGKAEEIVRRELEKKETPSLYCLLGDILREHQYYDRAWEVSGRRSARAMRSKALLHLHNKEFQQCVDCFEQSLKINCMQLGVWFSLGCAYFALEGYEGAAKSFQRCVGLEPDNAEAWNNLSTAYIRLQMKNKAFRTLQEALKCNYEHWQIWENFIVVSTDIGDFAEVIKAYHRLMDLRENYKDIQILKILVRAVVENLTDSEGQQAGALQSKLKELFGRISSRHSSDAEIWRQYALLYGGGHSSNPEDNEKALQFLSKAHRCDVQTGGWEKEPALFKEVIKRGIHMGEVTVSCSEKKSNPSEALQMLSTTRLSLRSLATKAKQMHTDVATGQIHTELQDGVATLEQLITELQELSGKLRNQSQ